MNETLVVGEHHWRLWMEHFGATSRERMAFGYCGGADDAERTQYLVRAVDLPDDEEYVMQWSAGVALKAAHAARRATRARGHTAIVDLHSHPFTGHPVPSRTDQDAARRERLVLRDLAPGCSLIRLIVGRDGTVWGEVAEPGEGPGRPLQRIVIVGPAGRRVLRPCNAPTEDHPRCVGRSEDVRTHEVLGGVSTAVVRSLRVLVVGGGGVGSAVAAQLRGYVDDIALVDPDRVEIHNAPRLCQYRAGDEGRPKVQVLARHVVEGFPSVNVQVLDEAFPSTKSLELFKRADVVFCCPDHNAARYATAQAGARYLKPVIEVGCGGRRIDSRIGALGYHVRLQVPGGPCLVCNGLDLRALEDPETTAEKKRIGYLEDGTLVAGELMPLTTRAAADAVDVFFRVFTGYAGPAPGHLYFDALAFREVDATPGYASDPACPLCGTSEGSLYGSGDGEGPGAGILPSPPSHEGAGHASA